MIIIVLQYQFPSDMTCVWDVSIMQYNAIQNILLFYNSKLNPRIPFEPCHAPVKDIVNSSFQLLFKNKNVIGIYSYYIYIYI